MEGTMTIKSITKKIRSMFATTRPIATMQTVEAGPRAYATVNVATGDITTTGEPIDQASGAIVYGTRIDPWGQNETGMSRADAALARMGLTRASGWTRSTNNDSEWIAPLAPFAPHCCDVCA